MISVNNADILDQHRRFMAVYASGAAAPFLTSDYVANAFPRLEERANAARLQKMQKELGAGVKSIYPYEVKIPKSLNEMQNFDFEPAKVVRVEGPIKGPYSNIWFGDSTDGVNFRWGYINGDSRKITDDALDDTTVHGFLGGATGQGKSVTLNAFIYGCCMEYPPWEVVLTLSDAKIVEFKSIAVNHPMPHIDIVAATSDVDYLLSMLTIKNEEMKQRNQVFTNASQFFKREIKNIKDFRRVTGLVMPRNVMVFDECTAMFQNAGKRASEIIDLLDGFARLGRNTGMHMLLTSQEVSSDLPEKTMFNLSLRGAMGCDAPVSEKILGNDEAVKNKGLKGRLIVNRQASSKNSKESNVSVRVPFMPDDQVKEISDSVISRGKEFGLSPILRFFDGEAMMYEKDYREFLSQFESRADRIVLGPPSFIVREDEQCVQYRMPIDDVENICVLANSERSKLRAFKMLKLNIFPHREITNLVMLADSMYAQKDSVDELAGGKLYKENNYETSNFIALARTVIYRRRLCLKADDMVFTDGTTDEEADELFYSIYEKGGPYDTVTNRCRAKHYVQLLRNDAETMAGMAYSKSDFDIRMSADVQACIKLCDVSGCAERQVKSSDFSRMYCWILGMERIIGLGRDTRMKNTESFKKMLQDCTAANVRFVLFTSSMDDVDSLYKTFGMFLLEDISTKQATQIKCYDDWPEKVSSTVMFKYNPNESVKPLRMQKFLKMLLDGELPV